MAKKLNRGLGLAIGLLGGAFAFLFLTRDRTHALPPGSEPEAAPPPSEVTGGTETEPAPEAPVQASPVREGNDRFPRYATAIVSTSTGPEEFEKEYDTDLGQVRWINFKSPNYGTYRDIGTLSINHPPISIRTATGTVLWENGQFTHAGQQFFGFPPGVPLNATVY